MSAPVPAPAGSPVARAAAARRRAFWVALAGLLVATHWPRLRVAPVDAPIDKLAHAAGFGSLAALCLLAFPRIPRWGVAALMLALGAVDEWTQAIPVLRRSCDLDDWLADATGIVVALALHAALSPVGGAPARLLLARRRTASDLLLARPLNWLHLMTAAVLGAAAGAPLAVLIDSWFVRKGPQPVQYGFIGALLGAGVAVHALWEAGVRSRLRRAEAERPCLGCGTSCDGGAACAACGRLRDTADWAPVASLDGGAELRACLLPVLVSVAALVFLSTASIAVVTSLRLRVDLVMRADTWYRTLPADGRILVDLSLLALLGAWALRRCRSRIARLVDRTGDSCTGCGFDLRATSSGTRIGGCPECGGGFVRLGAPPA